MREILARRLSSTGPHVIELQTLLSKTGHYHGGVVGVFNADLEEAVKAFQSDNGLVDDGEVIYQGGVTWPKLVKAARQVPVGSYKRPPFATVLPQKMKSRGTYRGGWPRGAIVHFTAGRDGAEKTINGGIENGYTFWCIQRDGRLFTAHDADQWGYHAGSSKWPGLDGTVSDELLGIEINAAGRLTKLSDGRLQSWFKTIVPKDEARQVPGKRYPGELAGYYEKYTDPQESTLVNTLLWLKAQRPDQFSFDLVLGHDEVAPGRKNDPGGALSMTMPEFRAHLKSEWAKREGSK